jgi:SAM-dependent methyltransferase
MQTDPHNLALWEETHASRKWGAYPPEDIVRWIAQRYKHISKEERKNTCILDLGCGQGAVTWFLAREGFSVIGVDISPSAVEKTRARLEEDGYSADLVIADIRKLPFETDSFDCVLDIESIYANTTDGVRECIKEAHRVLKKNGVFFSMAFSTDCSNFGTGTKLEEHTYTDIPYGSPSTGVAHYFDEPELKEVIENTGFALETFEKKNVTRNNQSDVISQWMVYAKKQ